VPRIATASAERRRAIRFESRCARPMCSRRIRAPHRHRLSK
jgi:hypothetical protein